MLPREAKEYLIAQIVREAETEDAPLSDIERRMLYFTETGWIPEDCVQLNEEFERKCSNDEYEQRVARLVRNLCKRPEHDDALWKEARRALLTEDHYLSILIDPSMLPRQAAPPERPPYDWLKLILSAIGCILLLLALEWFVNR